VVRDWPAGNSPKRFSADFRIKNQLLIGKAKQFCFSIGIWFFVTNKGGVAMVMTTGLGCEGGRLFLDGELIFTVPVEESTSSRINLAGYWEPAQDIFSTIYVGSGSCCHGHLYELIKPRDGAYILGGINSVDTNVWDILPVSVDCDRAGFPTPRGVLVVGHGCAGSGVRLISTYYPQSVDVVPAEQYRSQFPPQELASPIFRVDHTLESIYLDFRRAGWRVKPGKRRNPALPSIVADSEAEEYFISSDLWSSLNITSRLEEVGVDLGETLGLVSSYRRLFA